MRKRTRRFFDELFCRHNYYEKWIFGAGTYADKKRCNKCGKSVLLWRGTRKEWRIRHGFDHVSTGDKEKT